MKPDVVNPVVGHAGIPNIDDISYLCMRNAYLTGDESLDFYIIIKRRIVNYHYYWLHLIVDSSHTKMSYYLRIHLLNLCKFRH